MQKGVILFIIHDFAAKVKGRSGTPSFYFVAGTFLFRSFLFLQGSSSCGNDSGLTQPRPAVPFLSKRKEPKIRQRGGFLFGNTSASCVVLFFCVRSREWAKPILQTFYKNVAGLLSPRPRFLSSRKERNQRFAKEEVSSLETPLRGTSPRELRKRSSLPLSAPPASKCQVLHLLLRKVSGYIVADSFLGAWGFKRGLPLS